MPLIKTILATERFFALQALTDFGPEQRELAQLEFADAMAFAIDRYIKSATIIVPPGQVVTGTAGPVPVIASTTTPSSPATII